MPYNSLSNPDYLLFAQHGWSDIGNDIGYLGRATATENAVVIAPSLGLLKTYWRIANLVKQVEQIAAAAISQNPTTELRIMGHSMGGLIWLEVLDRHPEWWEKVHSLVVIGSPIAGAHLAKAIDPLGLGIGIARDLGKNRRTLAEKVAQHIPTLSIAGELGNGTDGMVTTEATKFAGAKTVIVPKVPHARLKCHLGLVPIIREFWTNPQITKQSQDLATKIIRQLQQVPGITDADYRWFKESRIALNLSEGITIRTHTNKAQIDRVFVADSRGNCLYAGYVGWLHKLELKRAVANLKTQYTNK